MITVDQRTRRDDEVMPVDAVDFFERRAAGAHRRRRLAGRARRAASSTPRSLAIEIERPAAGPWRSTTTASGRAARATTARRPSCSLDAEQLTDLVHDVRTPMGFLTGGDLSQERGRLDDLLDWWVVLRSLLDQRPAHTAGVDRLP